MTRNIIARLAKFMLSDITVNLILGDQLFYDSQLIKIAQQGDIFVMVESTFLSQRNNYHKQKLAYIYTCMRHYGDYLESRSCQLNYSKLESNQSFESILGSLKKNQNITKVRLFEVTDKTFRQYLVDLCQKFGLEIEFCPNPMFLLNTQEFGDYLNQHQLGKKRMLMNNFYIWHRKKLNLLLNKEGKPLGDKWSLDEDNRKKLPKDTVVPKQHLEWKSSHFEEVKSTIERISADNPGSLLSSSWLPVTHEQALEQLHFFLNQLLNNFGDYEDAMTTRSDFVFHSVLSPMLNNGLLTPNLVLEELQNLVTAKGLENLKLNSVEGYIRQLIGWREWMKGLYDWEYNKPVASYNFFEHHKPLPDYFWKAELLETSPELKLNLPLKSTLSKVFKYGWCHHIERLMILSNWMLMSEYDPLEVYDWFNSMFVDAYEWVMIPNVIGMGQFADGGIFATKPYFSGGNYLKKMSDYPDSKIWETVWTGLFWKFLFKHEEFFRSQPRLAMLLNTKNRSETHQLELKVA